MDDRLYKAALEGNVGSLLSLVEEDALILHRDNTNNVFQETPLHIAAMLGHEEFAIQLLRLRPDLARERDSQGSSPLHLASAKGNLAIVKACLQVNDHDVCYLRNRDGKNPVHVAAMRGRVDVLGELLRVKPDAGRAIVEYENRSILHLCVECGQFEGLKFLVQSGKFQDMVNWRDKNGNTILHLAVTLKQAQTTDFLLGIATIDVNALNHSGLTAMDILMQRGRDIRDLEIEESLIRSRATVTRESNSGHGTASYSNGQHDSLRIPRRYKPIKPKNDWLERKKSALMVVASLIATMAFQVGVSPPKKNENDPNVFVQRGNNTLTTSSVVLYNYLKSYTRFYIVNTTSFIASLSIILLLMSGLPIKNKLFMWILLVITWVAITSIALSYTISVILSAPQGNERSIDNVIGTTMLVWLGLMMFLLICHTLRLTWLIVVGLVRLIWKMVNLMIKPFGAKRRVFVTRGNV